MEFRVSRAFLIICLMTLPSFAAEPGDYNLPGKAAVAPAPATTEPASPMEDLDTHVDLSSAPMVLFTESRDLPVRRMDGIPKIWMDRPADQRWVFHGHAQPGEYYVFQVAVHATKSTIGPIGFSSSGLPGTVHCISLGGIGNDGKPFSKSITVAAGHLVPLWFGIDVPVDAKGTYLGKVTVSAGKDISADASINLDVSGDVLSDDGISDPSRLARLKWLDSTVGSESTVTKPFIPVTVKGNFVSILGRDVQLGDSGLPAKITSHFSGSNTHLVIQGRDLLAAPISFEVDTGDGPLVWKSDSSLREASDSALTWTTHSTSGVVNCDVSGRMEFDGMIALDVQIKADQATICRDMSFNLPMRADVAKYLMGLGQHGGNRPAALHWKWDADKFQDAVWIGDVNAGVMCRFKGENYHRPLVNIYYPFAPLAMPESWSNGGAGGIDVLPMGADRVVVRAYTGPRNLKAGQTLHFKIEMYLTPFKLVNTDQHWSDRFIHPFEGSGQKVVDHVLQVLNPDGPNVVEIHHATYTNPYINYPYNSDSLPALKSFVEKVHELKSRLLVYYTTRELTTNLPELFALHSLDGEVIFPGPGADSRTIVNPKGPDRWLTDHLRDSFIPAWRAHIGSPYNKPDLAVITTPDSRWNNFYLEGLKFLCDRVGIDGVYIDDTALDHRSLQRARRILDTAPGRLIDVHSWNHNNVKAHFSNSAIVYMELFPYIDRLWLGEGFDCNKVSPDYWLIEMSGIPYGLNADMLQGGGNPWLGMLYGEIPKLGWTQGDPRPMWKFWDSFGMTGSEMIGYWDTANPVHTDNANVLATIYRKANKTLIVLGNFSEKPVSFRLKLDDSFVSGKVKLTAPEIEKLQKASSFYSDDELTIDGKKGLFLIVDTK
jgi:hypothetical protein